MTRGLDAPLSDAELLRRYEAQQAASRKPVALGPLSPLRPDTESRVSRKRRPVLPGPSEHSIQSALFDRVNSLLEQMRRPALALVHAVPNGGARTMATAGKLKAEGVKPGVPDIDCPVARGGYFGLRIEMKRPAGTTTPEQSHWLSALAREGHKVALHTTAEGAWQELIDYLDLPRTEVVGPLPPSAA